MREQDVQRIAAEVLAALREGAPAGADRPVGHGETGTGVVPSAGRGGKPEAAQKYRDTLKTLAVKTDDQYTYLVLGIENQSHVHYAMPVRNMLYDAMQLEKQVRDLASQHRKEGKNGTSEEYLSGMKKEDRLSPVITLVINFGGKKWDAPLSLREMYGEQPEKVLPFIQDYRVFMIDPMEMSDNDLQKLNSSLRGNKRGTGHQCYDECGNCD